MRVTLVIGRLECGGAQRVLATMANYWSARGWSITLVTIAGDECFYALDSAVRHVSLGHVGAPRHPMDRLANGVRRLRALRRAIRESRPDGVISFIDKTNVLTLAAAAGLGVPVIVSERGDPATDHVSVPWKLARRWTYPRAAYIVAVNEQIPERFPASWRPRIAVIPNAVPAPAWSAAPGHAPAAPYIVAMGRMDAAKAFDMLIRSFARVAGGLPEWSLAILGDGPERPALEALTRALGLEGRVQMPGEVRDSHQWLRGAALFASGSRIESFGNAICEAMACGLAVLAVECVGPRAIITNGHDGLLVPRDDLTAFASTLDRLMSDPAERARLGANASTISRRFAPDAIMGEWERLLSASQKDLA